MMLTDPLPNHQTAFNPDSDLMFIRNPGIGYLQSALMTDAKLANRIAAIGYNFTLGDKALPDISYIDMCRKAVKFIEDHLDEALTSTSGFEGFLNELASQTAYVNSFGKIKEGHLRDRQVQRNESVPILIYQAINNVLKNLQCKELDPIKNEMIHNHQPFGGMQVESLPVINNHSTIPIDLAAETVRAKYKKALESYNLGASIRATDLAISGLFEMLNAWFFDGANLSRSMLIFNVMLNKIGIQGLPHGAIDFAAYLMPPESFNIYIKFLLGLDYTYSNARLF